MRNVKYRVESKNGDDKYTLPASKTAGEVENLLNKNMFVTIERKEGNELLVKADLPSESETEVEADEDNDEDSEDSDDDVVDDKLVGDWEKTFKTPPKTPTISPTTAKPKTAVNPATQKKITEVLTPEQKRQNEWAKKFEKSNDIISVTASKKSGGG
jgi:hypothetical protein